MIKKIILTLLLFVLISPISVFANKVSDSISAPFKRVSDTRVKEIKYQYEVLKADEEKNIEGKIYNRTPSGYMTVDEYEALSEYKDRSTIWIIIHRRINKHHIIWRNYTLCIYHSF